MQSEIRTKRRAANPSIPWGGADSVAWEAAKNHAIACYPDESCGVIADGFYRSQLNMADNPRSEFEIDPKVFVQLEVECVVHSHGEEPPYPTESDMEHQIVTDVPWAIIVSHLEHAEDPILFGDQLPIPPLLGRPFRHGVTDCCSLIRDYYRLELGITIPEYPRSWGWWADEKDKETGEILIPAKNLYVDFFQDAGFRDLRPGERERKGDVFLANVKSDNINHAGILLDGGKILHHPFSSTSAIGYAPSSLSREDSASRWMSSVLFRKWVRYGN